MNFHFPQPTTCPAVAITSVIASLVAEHNRLDVSLNPNKHDLMNATSSGIQDMATALSWVVPISAEGALAMACVLHGQVDNVVVAIDQETAAQIADVEIDTAKRMAINLMLYIEKTSGLKRADLGLDYFCAEYAVGKYMPHQAPAQ